MGKESGGLTGVEERLRVLDLTNSEETDQNK